MPATTAKDATAELIRRFESAFNTRDYDALMADMTDNPVFEHFAPEGASIGRHEGRAAVRAVWEGLEEHFPGYRFDLLDIFGAGDRGVCRWSMTWRVPGGGVGSMQGVDVFRVRAGKISEKLTYTV